MRHSKYGAKRTEVDGIKFPSKGEAMRWSELKLLEKSGRIKVLRRQVKFPLTVNGEIIGHYLADFAYFENGVRVVEESKGYWTALAKWKRKHFEAEYLMRLRVTGAAA